MKFLAADPNSSGILSNTAVTFFGPAFNTKEADGLLGFLESRGKKDPAAQVSYELKIHNHFADIVGLFSGGNPSTGGFVPAGSSLLAEKSKVLFGEVTVHTVMDLGAQVATGIGISVRVRRCQFQSILC